MTSLRIAEKPQQLPVQRQLATTQTAMSMKRVEMKYILSKEQVDFLKEALRGHMLLDRYGLTTIASIYYDTIDYRLIRNSIEKPPYKEKMRVRSYGLSHPGGKVYLEIKRKCEGLVYKRRISSTESEVADFLTYAAPLSKDGQIEREITSFRNMYGMLLPAIMVMYDREAYYEENGDLRLTIDFNPRYRTDNLNLHTSMEGKPLLPEGYAILEIKVQQAMPLWLTRILSEGKIYKTSFSKVGAAYKAEAMIRERN